MRVCFYYHQTNDLQSQQGHVIKFGRKSYCSLVISIRSLDQYMEIVLIYLIANDELMRDIPTLSGIHRFSYSVM